MGFENRNYAFASAFVDELARSGLRHVCICPGSRSSPLTISFSRHPGIKTWMHLDERSSSFFALGMARYLGQPVALVCSSGTAAANFFPAVVEARYSGVPLLALTADRPPELLDWGALQTIDQTRIYGSHAKWSVNVPTPEVTPALMAFVRSMAARAFATAAEAPAGPVHVNFPFREPLEPASVPADFAASVASQSYAHSGRPGGVPFVSAVPARRAPDGKQVEGLARRLASVEQGLIVCGPQADVGLAEAVSALAQRLDYPVLADCLSQVRCGPHDRDVVIDCYDAFIRDAEVAESLVPKVVIRFGALPVSKPLTQYLERHRSAHHILVDEENGWRDPFHLTSEVWHVDSVEFCEKLASALEGKRAPREWSGRWRRLREAARDAIARELAGFGDLFEGKVFSELAQLIPEEAVLFVGNSMPVRDMDTFFPSTDRRIRFMANRGASGIDGVVSTALGTSAASGRVMLVLGDLSFYHDMNGLLAARAFGLNATIIVINNNGGGIFSFLPQAAYEEVFEPYFGTPHGLTFRSAAELYGLRYRLVEDWPQFREALQESLTSAGTTLIEVPGDRKENVVLHRRIWAAVAAGIRAGRGG
ncbi:MAG: 2-succinyl-5-enolpyruvyl-6-hydroxy-3-cyclohexene-1-carboxylic-acid synthase [Chloroflexi bacterium]|nr:2-succinyl-5-enolpyruvyl-6-hydroxy-3-cyclohexene-1-carboxylic-acid synthase [Chloroflexota bacterium]